MAMASANTITRILKLWLLLFIIVICTLTILNSVLSENFSTTSFYQDGAGDSSRPYMIQQGYLCSWKKTATKSHIFMIKYHVTYISEMADTEIFQCICPVGLDNPDWSIV